MNYSSLEGSLSKATKKFDEVAARREKLIKESRDVIISCSKSIVAIHTSNFVEAKRLARQASEKLHELKKIAGEDLVRYIVTAEQEYVEASILQAIASDSNKVPGLDELSVGAGSYILGVLDAVGELKRSVYDKIRLGEINEAENLFKIMESFYVMVSPFAVYDNITQGIRRKLDVARMLIDDTRSTVTEEIRRREFISSVNDVASKFGGERSFVAENPRRPRETTRRDADEAEGGSDNDGDDEE